MTTATEPRQWADVASGEVVEGPCPNCAEREQWAEDQVRGLELEARNLRSKATKAERAMERAEVSRRDGAAWNDVLAYWLEVFPDKRPSSKGVKSARATKFFMRLEAGATLEDVKAAIRGAKKLPFVVFGKRRATGSKSDLATDLQEIVSVGNDAQFDALVEAGREAT